LASKFVKEAVESALTTLAPIARRVRGVRQDILILAYHNVVPGGERVVGERSLHVSREAFAAQLDVLRRTHDVIPLEAVAEPSRGRRPRAVITFDDAYAGALTAGVAELEARRLPATVFVAPAYIPDQSFWWDALAGGRGLLDDHIRATALIKYEGREGRVRDWAVEAGLAQADLPAHARAGSLEELHAAANVPGISIGSHTLSHCNLAVASPHVVSEELCSSRDWLADRFPSFIPWLSYPYGAANRGTPALVRAAGYRGALLIRGGWYSRRHDHNFELPRVNIPRGLSIEGFKLRAAGLVGR
jgi:peptidoglycan/xylan/chitin deacetylase (PgdA/CDA1 family)